MTFSLIAKVRFKTGTGTGAEIEPVIPIFLDDPPSLIKKKVSLIQSSDSLLFIPFIRLDLLVNNKDLVKLTSESPIQILDSRFAHLDPFSTELEIIVTTLLDDLLDANFQEIVIETYRRNMIFYEKFLKDYPLLREDTFQMALNIVSLKSNSGAAAADTDIESDMNYILSEMNKTTTEMTKMFANLTDYLKSVSQITYSAPRPEEFLVTNINYRGTLGGPLDIVDLFNTFSLSEDIPFIGIGGQFVDRTNPVVRVFKLNNQRVIPEKEIKDFYVTENKKQNLVVYKKIKGIVFKIKIPQTSAYLTLLIEPNGTFWLNLKPNKTQTVIDTVLNDLVLPLLLQFKTQADKEIVFQKINVSVNIETPFHINLDSFVGSIKRPSISKTISLFELKPSKSTELTSFLYKKEITINLKDNPFLLNSSILSILGVSGWWQLCAIYTQILIVDNTSVAEGEGNLERQQIRERSNIKRLKELGVKVKSTNCQKQRQPVIVDPNTVTVLKHPESYTLNYAGQTYMCTSDEHPFPGFTNENILCCFKKDQRQKEAFIRNVTPQALVSSEASSKTSRKQHVITTEKLLQNNRFGVLPNGLRESIIDILGIPNIFRYGVIQDQLSLVNALAKVDSRFEDNVGIFWKEFQAFVLENFDTLQKLYVKNLNDLISDTPTPLDNPALIIISFFTKRNYFIFEEEKLECADQIVSDLSHPFVILIRRDIHWELVVEKNLDDTPTISFKRDHPLVKFLEKYYDYSCKKEDLYPVAFKDRYTPLPDLNQVLGKISGIQYQVVNMENNKVNFVSVKDRGLIPVKESTPKFGIHWKWISEIQFPTFETQVDLLKNPSGIVVENQHIVGIVSQEGVMCPVVPVPRKNYTGPLKEVSSLTGPYILRDQVNWNHTKEETSYQRLRLAFARYLNRVDTDLRDTILQIVTNLDDLETKRDNLNNLIPVQFKLEYSDLDISDLITDLLVENTTSDIINNTVSSKFANLVSTLKEDILYDVV